MASPKPVNASALYFAKLILAVL